MLFLRYVLLVSLVQIVCCNINVETLVKSWAPLVWLAPEEKYFPSTVNEFWRNVLVFEKYLEPVIALDILEKNSSSFIFGHNPAVLPIPIYATVKHCPKQATLNRKNDENYAPTFKVSYWTFYPYNKAKLICFTQGIPIPSLRFEPCEGELREVGNHLGDWEHVTLFFDGQIYPKTMYVAMHDYGAYYEYDLVTNTFQFNRAVVSKGLISKLFVNRVKFAKYIHVINGTHPQLFAAQGSHGLWPTPGINEYNHIYKLTDDTGYGTKWRTWENMEIYHIDSSVLPPWMKYNGTWGNKVDCSLILNAICPLVNGPIGIIHKKRFVEFECPK